MLLERALEQLDEAVPAVLDERCERLELILGRFGRRILPERARVRVERLLGVEQLRALQLADAEQQRRAAERVLLGGELDLVHADERGPLLELLVDGLEDVRDVELLLVVAAQVDLERLARLRVTDVDVEDVAIDVDRARDVAEVLLLELAEPVLQLDVLRPCSRRGR